MHYGIRGMKWGVWNSETRARHEGGSSKPKRSTAAPTARYERVGRVKGQGRMSEVGGKTYKQSRATSKAQRKAAKYLRLSVEKPSASNTVKAQAWQNKAAYEQRRDMGRSRGTRTAKGVGYGLASLGGAAIGAGVATGQIPVAAVGAGTVAVGKTVVTKAMRREYKVGYRLETGKTRISQEKRTSKLDRYDDKIVKTSEKQKQASSKYGADSKQNKKALKKYGKAKDRFESEYEKLNPERARLYRD